MNIQDNTEFEAKFYPVNKEEYRKKLLAIGAKLVTPERKMKRSVVDSVHNKSLKCDYIRVRDEGNSIRISAKIHARPNGKVSDQKELDITVSDYDKSVEIFKLMGFTIDRYQETLRETWSYKNAEIVIDTWPGLSTYSEIEASSEAEVKEIAEELGFNWENKIITGVAYVYSKVYGIPVEEAIEKVSFVTFENNPFKNLPKVWDPKTQNEG